MRKMQEDLSDPGLRIHTALPSYILSDTQGAKWTHENWAPPRIEQGQGCPEEERVKWNVSVAMFGKHRLPQWVKSHFKLHSS